MKKIKKYIAVLLLSLTLFNSIFASYSMSVKAAEAIPITMSALDALLALFGIDVGLGNQSSFFSNQDEIIEFIDAVASGRTVNIPLYGEVNFSDGESILSWMNWAQKCHSRIAGNNVVDVAFDTSILTLAKALDSASYKNSGVSATNVMEKQITNFISDYTDSVGDLGDAVKDAFSVVNGTSSADDGKNMTPTRFGIFKAMIGSFLFGAADTIKDFSSSLRTPAETEYTEYDSAFSDAEGFVPGASLNNFSYTADPSYSNYSSYKVIVDVGIINNRFIQKIVPASYVEYGACFILNPYMNFYCLNNNQVLESKNYDTFIHIFESDTFYHSVEGFFNQNEFTDYGYVSYIPVFSDTTSAYAFFNEGDTSGILNLVDDSAYPNFKAKAKPMPDSFAGTIDKLLEVYPSIDTLKDKVPAILDTTDAVAGTADAVPAVEDAIAEAAGIGEVTDSETETGTSTGILGILSKILNAILALPANMLKVFTDPIGTINENWEELLKRLAAFGALAQGFFAAVLIAINALPPINNDDNDSSDNTGTVNLLNGLLMLLSILYMLLCIFLHLLEFIINIFKIPADPGFIEGDFAIGFEYIKTVQLSPLSISVYDFLMGLVHILLFFSIVKVLKRHIDKIHI